MFYLFPESPDSSISRLVCDPNLYQFTLDLLLHLPLKSVIVFAFNSFLYYIPVIKVFSAYIDFQSIFNKLCPYHRQKKIEKERRIEEKNN